MMKTILLAAACTLPVLAAPIGAGAQDNKNATRTTTTVAGIQYRDCAVELPGQPPGPCGGTGIIYTILPQGRVMVSVPLRDGALLAFVASADKQVRPEDYVMYLSHLRLTRNGQNQTQEVSGTCQAAMSPDGKIWLNVTCEATDAARRVVRLRMTGNGTPAEVVRG
jgi:hypothetical protein